MAGTSNQKELVRLLYLEHGHQKASELSGVNYDLVRKWASLGNWRALHKPSQTPVAKATERLTDVLQQRKHESRTLLSEYQIRAATEAAAHEKPLSITRQVNDLASIHSKVWPEEQNTANVFSLNVLSLNMFDESDA